MKLLVLGGTVFAGRAFADLAASLGHDVTIFHRGRRLAPELEGRVHTLIGDRHGALGALESGRWDAAIDFSGYVPGIVEQSARLLEGRVGRYVFISTVSVYPEFTQRDEDTPVLEGHEGYGALKARCEEVVRRVFALRATILRPGLIIGPHDATDRYTYWIRRLSKGGETLAPGDGARLVQGVDVRDLAEFCLRLVRDDREGTFNVKGDPTPFKDLLASIARVTPTRSTLCWLPEDYLLEHGVEQWTELPLWIAGKDQDDPCAMAKTAGLSLRPLTETARATLSWDLTRDPAVPLKAGLAEEKEKRLLSEWASTAGG